MTMTAAVDLTCLIFLGDHPGLKIAINDLDCIQGDCFKKIQASRVDKQGLLLGGKNMQQLQLLEKVLRFFF